MLAHPAAAFLFVFRIISGILGPIQDRFILRVSYVALGADRALQGILVIRVIGIWLQIIVRIVHIARFGIGEHGFRQGKFPPFSEVHVNPATA